MIPNNDDHSLLTPKKPTEIEVIQETLMTYRVIARGFPSPAKFVIQ